MAALAAASRVRMTCARVWTIAAELAYLQSCWPMDLPTRRSMPISSRTMSARTSRAHRFLFRLQRSARLRPDDLPQRLVFETDGQFQRTKGMALIETYPEDAAFPLGDDEIAARGGSRACAAFTRLVDWLNVPEGALVKPAAT